MSSKDRILICRVDDFYLGFEISEIQQVIITKKVNVDEERGTINVRGKQTPFLNIFRYFDCKENSGKFLLILGSKKGSFASTVSKIEGFITFEPGSGLDLLPGLKSLVRKDYAKRVVLFNKLPVVVVDTQKITMGEGGSH